MNDYYTMDANVVITLNRDQPRDVYRSVWTALEQLIAAGRCWMIREIYEELKKVDDECAPWAKAQAGFIRDTTAEELHVVSTITNQHPGWVQETLNAADPFIVAHAEVQNLVIVTQERRKGPGTIDENLKIPNVADERGITCVTFKDLARREGWIF